MGILASKLTKSKLTQQEITALSKEVIRRIVSNSNPLQVYIFGSATDQSMTMISDFDFAIIFSNETDLKKEKKHLLNLKLFPDINLDLLFFNVDDFDRKSKIGGVCWEIKNKGKIIYDQRAEV